MVFDTKTRQIFILGRYLERGLRDRAQNIKVSWLVKLQINLMEKSDISGDGTGKKNLPKTREMKFTMLTSSRYLIFNLLQSDFFKYDIDANQWTMITDDTSTKGGPMLIFDHQMCIDTDTQTIYVFGGQSLFLSMTDGPVSITEKMYSGLYEYHIPSNTWKKKR